jgi:hypothetical protein
MALKVYSERVLNLYSVSIISCQTHIITVIKSFLSLFSFLLKDSSGNFEEGGRFGVDLKIFVSLTGIREF